MCGIAGVVRAEPGDLSLQGQKLLRAMAHRGPDDEGWVLATGTQVRHGKGAIPAGNHSLVMVHTRLAILDLSANGHQPMSSLDGRYVIVFNGEIYNYVELRNELAALGHKFHTACDTEVLLAAYIHWGSACLNHLTGMFAFAVVDFQEQKLFLARDQFGIKPLYYTLSPAGFAFASEIPPLLTLLDGRPKARPESIATFVRFGLTDGGDKTMFADIYRLKAAHHLSCSLANPSAISGQVCYWNVPAEGQNEVRTLSDLVSAVREGFIDNVRLHLRSDVPVGAALSGGIDSSAIVAAMRHVGGSSVDLHTFTFSAEDRRFDEAEYAEIVAKKTAATRHVITVRPGDFWCDLPALTLRQGEPFATGSIYAQYRVFKEAADRGVTVILDGQGADELFAGYDFYVPTHFWHLIDQGMWREALSLHRNMSQKRNISFMHWISHKVQEGRLLDSARTLFGRARTGGRYLNESWLEHHAPGERAAGIRPSHNTLHSALSSSISSNPLPQLLRFDDRNSMAHSRESRVPFLTPSFVSLCMQVPSEFKIDASGTSKSIFRHAMRGLVPDPILDRVDKLPFPAPDARWLSAVVPQVTKNFDNGWLEAVKPLDLGRARLRWNRFVDDPAQYDHNLLRWISLAQWTQTFNVSYD